MWRYGNTAPYKEHFACFRCRKAFKQPPAGGLPEHGRRESAEPHVVRCPQCREPMAGVGKDFEAPRQSDVKRWEAVEVLHRHGIKLAGGLGPLSDLKDVEALLAARGLQSPGEKLLRKIRWRRERGRP